MKFTVTQEVFKTALNRAVKGVEMNSTIPVLAGILIKAEDSQLILENTDLNVSLRQTVIANIEEPGQIVVPSKLLNDIIGHLEDGAVLFETDKKTVNITCGKSYFSINTFSVQDFPEFPSYSIDSTVELPVKLLNNMVDKVIVAASDDKSRAILNSILLTISSGKIRLVTTDLVRLAVAEAAVTSSYEVAEFSIIAPSKNLKTALSLASNEKTVTVGTNASQIIFSFGDVTYVTRRIEGNYPSYEKLIPRSSNTSMTVKMNDLYFAMQRVRTMTVNNSEITFQIDVNQGQLNITSRIPDQGRAREELAVDAQGDDLTISFNSRYIYDGLERGDDNESITFEADNPSKPGVFKTHSDIDFLYLVMPVRSAY